MIVPPPPSAFEARAAAPLSLEEAFLTARSSVRTASDPAAVLASDAPAPEKLAALDALQSRLPGLRRGAKIAALDALGAATGAGQPPEVRAKALAYLGYEMPQVDDDGARGRALTILLAAIDSPAYRLFALRGLGPACQGLPKADEARLQGALLDLLDGPVSGEERATALVALFSLVSTREDLSERAPALVAALDSRLFEPIEADPARFAADPRFNAAARAMAIATVWSSARHRQALGEPAPAARVRALLERLEFVETDPYVLHWIRTYLDAAPARPAGTLRDKTTKRAPAGPDEP